jgi:hypothetical protein
MRNEKTQRMLSSRELSISSNGDSRRRRGVFKKSKLAGGVWWSNCF